MDRWVEHEKKFLDLNKVWLRPIALTNKTIFFFVPDVGKGCSLPGDRCWTSTIDGIDVYQCTCSSDYCNGFNGTAQPTFDVSSNGRHSGTNFFKPEKNLEFFRLKICARDDYPGKLE